VAVVAGGGLGCRGVRPAVVKIARTVLVLALLL
jgi:hypothetical protein